MRRDEDPGVAARVVLPIGDAAVLPADVGRPVETVVRTGIVGPDELSGAGVERGHLTERGADVEPTVHHERRGLELAWLDVLEPVCDSGRDRPPAPDDLQVGEVLRRDLVERRVLRVRRIGAEGAPLPTAIGRLRGDRGGRYREDHHAAESEAPAAAFSHRILLALVGHHTGSRRDDPGCCRGDPQLFPRQSSNRPGASRLQPEHCAGVSCQPVAARPGELGGRAGVSLARSSCGESSQGGV